MSIDAYTNPDFGFQEKLIFLAAALIGIIICIALIILGAKLTTASAPAGHRKQIFGERSHNRIQRFYEMIISGTSVMSFSCAYVIINHIYSLSVSSGSSNALLGLWENGRDFILLLLICLSCVLNTILDRIIIPLKRIDKEEKAAIRLLGMFYVILILVYLNFIGDESEYNPVMMYYLGLMVGRFVYFDASFTDFLAAVKNAFKNFPLLLMGLGLTAILCRFGFNAGYLLERNYYIVGVFYTHLFMLAAIFMIHLSHILNLLIRIPKAQAEQSSGSGFHVIGGGSENVGYDEEYDGEYDEEYDEDYEYSDEDYVEYDDYEEYDPDDYEREDEDY